MTEKPQEKARWNIIKALIGAAALITAGLLQSPIAARMADAWAPRQTATSAGVEAAPAAIPSAVPQQAATAAEAVHGLTINGVEYPLPDPQATPFCVAREIHTQGANKVPYDLVIPDGWVMVWNSRAAQWPGGSYKSDGLLVIRGPWQGSITIDTGGSCSGPVAWYNFIHQNRINDYQVPSRPEHFIP